MKRISVYSSFSPESRLMRENVVRLLQKEGLQPTKHGEILLVIGGDGTFLSAIKNKVEQNKYPIFFHVNSGHLGYFSEFRIEDEKEWMSLLKDKHAVHTTKHSLYTVRVTEESGKVTEDLFLNDFCYRNKESKAVHGDIIVGEKRIRHFAGDGIVVSSSVGSTGYNLGLGGALIQGNLPILQLSTIAPISNRVYKTPTYSTIFDHNETITIVPTVKKQRPVLLACDGRELRAKNPIEVVIQKKEEQITILRSKQFNIYTQNMHKLGEI